MELPQHTFIPFLSASSFLKPQRVIESAWIQHVPFAFWLVEQAKPKLFVELGVHTGMSYFAFCQSVKANQLSTLCYAVDTWKGDEHAGVYGEEVWRDVSEYNRREYASFSYLLRNTFSEAVAYFEDKTIDLLHIDGCHTYEAVKADFESWLPKMSENGLVLFHDTVVRERNFGVYKFWAEVKESYPTFEFIHDHGLGILSLGRSVSPQLQALFELKDEVEIFKVRYAYAALGNNAAATSDIDQKQRSRLQTDYQQLQAQYEELQSAHTLLYQEYGLLKNLAEEVKSDHTTIQANLQADVQRVHQQAQQAQAALEEARAAYAGLQGEITAVKSNYEMCATELEQTKNAHTNLIAQQSMAAEAAQQQHEHILAHVKFLEEQLQQTKDAYQQLKNEYGVLKKLADEAKNSQLKSRTAAEKIAQELKQKETALEQANKSYHTLQQQHEATLRALHQQLADTRRALSETQTHAANLNTELARQQQTIQWYKRTYEDRSLLGTLREKLRPRPKA